MQNMAKRNARSVIDEAFAVLDIEPDHQGAAEAEAAAWRDDPGFDDPSLADLSDVVFVTIDNPDSRDLDQALHIERDDDGYRVRYALADASWYVRPGTALYDEALSRGSSYYAPTRVAPMLPRLLSENLVSLEADRMRRAVVFDMRLDAEAGVRHTQIFRARVRSRAQLSYREVQAWFDDMPRRDEPIDDRWTESLRLLRTVGKRLHQRSRERGVVAFDRREAEVVLAGTPPRFEVRERARLDVEEWNAQISLLCNQEGAKLLAGLDARSDDGEALEPIYRVHEAPLPGRLRELRKRIETWVDLSGSGDDWRWKKAQSLADYVDGLPDGQRDNGRVRAIQRQILIVQRASEFRAEQGRHHALAVDGYARFSSPMREIVGIHTHRELLDALQDASTLDPERRDAVIASANAARRRQKSLDKAIGFAVIADLLEGDQTADPIPSRQGTVLGVRPDGVERSGHLYIGIDDLALDLKVYAEDLERKFGTPYTITELEARPAASASPRFLLGDAVSVRAAGFDETRQRFRLDAALRGAAARRERQRARPV